MLAGNETAGDGSAYTEASRRADGLAAQSRRRDSPLRVGWPARLGTPATALRAPLARSDRRTAASARSSAPSAQTACDPDAWLRANAARPTHRRLAPQDEIRPAP